MESANVVRELNFFGRELVVVRRKNDENFS